MKKTGVWNKISKRVLSVAAGVMLLSGSICGSACGDSFTSVTVYKTDDFTMLPGSGCRGRNWWISMVSRFA